MFLVLLFLDIRKRRKRANSLVVSKKKRKLLPFIPTEDPTRRLEQMASLATALTATGTEFSNVLTYKPGMAPRSANCSALERGGMQVNWKTMTFAIHFHVKNLTFKCFGKVTRWA